MYYFENKIRFLLVLQKIILTMSFIKYVFASALGTLLAGLVMFFIMFAIVVATISVAFDDITSEKSVKIKDNSVLMLDFDSPIKERVLQDQFEIPGFTEDKIGLTEIIKTIDNAKQDDRIEGIFLNFSGIQGGAATTEAIRKALLDFKTSDKWIIAYAEGYTQKGYYLASVADELYLNPEGMISFYGLSYKPMFMKDMLGKIGVEMQIIRGKNNKYKSAVEPFMYNQMSEANKIQSKQLISSVWYQIVDGIATERGITIDQVNKAADELSLYLSKNALEQGFIDGLKYQDEVSAMLAGKLGLEEMEKDRMIKYGDYKNVKLKKTKAKDFKKPKIAVIYAVGSIESGDGDDETIGSDRIAKAIKKARIDSTIKAIVFRVNSPGGSALASDVIWREVTLAVGDKPFVVSMGDLAASGGYYIACAADKIYAEHNTITGSIGVFGVLPNAKELLNDKIGVHFDGVKTNEHSDMMDISKPLKKYEYQLIQKSVDEIYASFLGKVADGRGLRVTYVDSIGQGRVWTGTDALELGLVDEIGGLDDAISWAAEKAELEDYRIKELPTMKNPFEELFESFGSSVQAKALESTIKDYELFEQFKYMQSIMNMKGVQARLPYYISF
jgi:protease-4